MLPETYREPRCHVCQNEAIRVQVNAMLAWGWSHPPIVRAVVAEGHPMSLDSVRNHAKRHFPEQNVELALYREILERRAPHGEIDGEDGAGTAITPLAYLEAVMVKGYKSLVRDDTEVSPEMGLRAAEKLHKAIPGIDIQAERARFLVELGRVIDVVKDVLPEHLWPELQARLKEGESDPDASEAVEPQQPLNRGEVFVVPIDSGDGEDDF